MGTSLACPKCESWLLAVSSEPADLKCPTCDGLYVPGSDARRALLQSAQPTAAGGEPLACPRCKTAMIAARMAGADLHYCPECWATWLPQGELSPDEEDQPFSLGRALLYGVSLPERAARSTVAIAAGAVQGTAAFLIPQCFQNSKTYEIVVKNSLRLLSEDVGGVQSKASDESPAMDNYVARKAVGNFVDLAGIATFHLSPLWLLAIVSDVAYGSRSYVLELAEELQREGLIDDSSTIHHVDDILDAVRKSSGSAAGLFDTPPLNADELKRTLRETKDAIANADVRSILPESELDNYWSELRELSRQEEVSLLGLSGAVTLHTLRKVGTVGYGTLTGIRVAGGLFNRHVFGHYGEALQAYRERGFYTALREDSTPYIEAVWNNFLPHRHTWTEEIFTGRAFSKLFHGVTGLFRKGSDADQPETTSPS